MKTRSTLLSMVAVALCIFATNGFLWSHQANAAAIQLAQTGLSKLRADFKVIKFTPIQWTCVNWPSYLSGYRNINFEVVIKNIWLVTSPYFQMMINDQVWFVAGGAIGMTLAPGETYTGGAGNMMVWWWYHYFTLTIYPIGLWWVPGTPTNPMDYMSWSLDGNVLNNTAVGRIYLDPCPQ